MTPVKPALIFLAGAILAAAASGCASKTAAPKPQASQSTPAKPQEEYVSQSSLGSWIPRKVKKSQAKTSEEESREAQMAMGELQQRGNAQPPSGN